MDLSAKRYAKLRSVHHEVPRRGDLGFQRRADHTNLVYAKALKKTKCESIETTIRKRRLIFRGGNGTTNGEAIALADVAYDDDSRSD